MIQILLVLIGLSALAACVPDPSRLAIAPACHAYDPGCLQAYQAHEFEAAIDERVLADRALCRAVPP
jgi:hypothetical protein